MQGPVFWWQCRLLKPSHLGFGGRRHLRATAYGPVRILRTAPSLTPSYPVTELPVVSWTEVPLPVPPDGSALVSPTTRPLQDTDRKQSKWLTWSGEGIRPLNPNLSKIETRYAVSSKSR